MDKTKNEKFQEQIDELLLMEKRIERRTNELTEYNNKLQKKIELSMTNVDTTIAALSARFEEKVEHKIARLNKLIELAHDGAINLAKHSKRWMVIFFSFAVIMAILTGSASWKLHGLVMQIAAGENVLRELAEKYSKTPQIIKYAGKDYIRIVKRSEMEFNAGKSKTEKAKWGTYAEVWHKYE